MLLANGSAVRALLPARNGFTFAPAAGALRTDAGRGGAGRAVANASATSVENASGAAAAAAAAEAVASSALQLVRSRTLPARRCSGAKRDRT